MTYRRMTVALVCGLLAVAACGNNDPDDSGPLPTPAPASVNGLASGAQRPARLTPQQYAARLEAVAEWARANELTGLSPMSLTPVDRGVSADARRAAALAAVAEFAIAEGLTGLSPVSLRPIDDQP